VNLSYFLFGPTIAPEVVPILEAGLEELPGDLLTPALAGWGSSSSPGVSGQTAETRPESTAARNAAPIRRVLGAEQVVATHRPPNLEGRRVMPVDPDRYGDRKARGRMASGPHLGDPDERRVPPVEPDPGVSFATGANAANAPSLRDSVTRREEDASDPYGPE
jgi:hypothetical protein